MTLMIFRQTWTILAHRDRRYYSTIDEFIFLPQGDYTYWDKFCTIQKIYWMSESDMPPLVDILKLIMGTSAYMGYACHVDKCVSLHSFKHRAFIPDGSSGTAIVSPLSPSTQSVDSDLPPGILLVWSHGAKCSNEVGFFFRGSEAWTTLLSMR